MLVVMLLEVGRRTVDKARETHHEAEMIDGKKRDLKTGSEGYHSKRIDQLYVKMLQRRC